MKVAIPTEPIGCEFRRDEGLRFFKDSCIGTLRTIDACGDKRVLEPAMCAAQEGYRVRKLTPKERWRLMGFDDEDFHKAEAICSNTQLYKQAGNGVTVSVIEAIARKMK